MVQCFSAPISKAYKTIVKLKKKMIYLRLTGLAARQPPSNTVADE